MSRVGNLPIAIPSGVEVTINGSEVSVAGSMGSLSQTFNSAMKISRDNGEVKVERPSDQREHRALHGTDQEPPRQHGDGGERGVR